MKLASSGVTPLNTGKTHTAFSLIHSSPCVGSQDSNQTVFECFTAHPTLQLLPVVDAQKPVGMIDRTRFLNSYARPFHREVYSRKPCEALMDTPPRVFEQSCSLEEISDALSHEDQNGLPEGFLITHEGYFIGMGKTQDLLRAVARLQREKHQQLIQSIQYASIIQHSFLHASTQEIQTLGQHTLIWAPRDVVGGDCYYCRRFDEQHWIVALIDCTGHGVPGAFMTLIVATLFDNLVNETHLHHPGTLLSALNHGIKQALTQTHEITRHQKHSDDGMDCAILAFSEGHQMVYAGARIPLWIMRKGQLECYAGERKGVGYSDTPLDYLWEDQVFKLNAGDSCYLFTDGLIDQIGGEKRLPFGKKRLKKLLEEHHTLKMNAQGEAIMNSLNTYQGSEARRDDISLFGYRVA